MGQLIQAALYFLRDILPCPNLKTFKLRCLLALSSGLAVDFCIRIYINWPTINFQISGPEISIILIVVVLLIFLVTIDAIIDDRRRKFAVRLRSVLTDPNVPPNVKEIIARALH